MPNVINRVDNLKLNNEQIRTHVKVNSVEAHMEHGSDKTSLGKLPLGEANWKNK